MSALLTVDSTMIHLRNVIHNYNKESQIDMTGIVLKGKLMICVDSFKPCRLTNFSGLAKYSK